MQFFDDISIQIIILVLGLCGFWVARRIRNHKTRNAPLVCPIGFDCHAVIHSDYSRLLGVPVEIFGMIYYALVSISYLSFIFIANIPSATRMDLVAFLIILSLLAFLFSVYLIFVQIFILKKGCSWCIVSALISALIFILTMLNYDLSLITQIFSK